MYKLIKLAQNKLFVVAMMLVVSAIFIALPAGEEPAGGSAVVVQVVVQVVVKTDVFGIKEVEKYATRKQDL